MQSKIANAISGALIGGTAAGTNGAIDNPTMMAISTILSAFMGLLLDFIGRKLSKKGDEFE